MTVAQILSSLSSSRIVERFEILEISIEPPVQSLRAKVYLTSGYVLYITESIGGDWRDYSYHLQKGERMIARWDNAPHWENLESYPYHKHLAGQKGGIASKEMFVDIVLTEIEKMITEK